MSDLLNSASLVMIPSGYAEDKVYSVVPSDGSGDMTLTRASNGTRVNSAGLVEVCPWNLLQYSEILDNGVWTKENATITANGTTAPNGTTTADLITSTSTSFSDIIQSTSQIAGQQYTFSCYGKKGNSDWIILRLTFADGAPFVWFNINSGTIGTINSGLTASIESVGNGWYRCSITGVASATPPASRIDVWLANANSSFSPNIGNSAYIWGAQLNIGSTAKPYFPTTDRLNVPRLTYQNGGGGCPSLLLEKQSTNIVNYSEQFDNANWQKENLTVTANSTTSPDGTQNADSFIENSLTASHQVYQGATVVAGAYSASVFMKKNTRQYGFLQIATDGAANRYTIVLDLDNGSVTATSTAGSPTGTSYKIDSMGNGWYRMTVTATHTSGEVYSVFGLSNSANPTFTSVATPTYTGNGTSGLYAWGAQLEASSYPTSYIPTTSSSATRVADACFKTGISSLIGQTEGTALLDFQFNGVNDAIILDIAASGLSPQNRIILYQPNSTAVQFIVLYNDTNPVSIASSSYAVGQRLKVAIAYKENDFAFYINGVQIGIDSSGSVPATSRIDIGNRQDGAYPASITVNEFYLSKTRLTNAQLASLTTI